MLGIALGGCMTGCFGSPEGVLGEVGDAGFADAGDVGATRDVGAARDVPGVIDAGADAGGIDASRDAGSPDVGADAGVTDSGFDAGARDGGVADAGARDSGARDSGLPDVGAAADAGALPPDGPALPAWDGATVAHIRAVRARGAAMGNRLSVFAKIGDSITESGSFLSDVGFGWGSLGPYDSLQPTITFFRMTALPSQDGQTRNSFNRASVCATAGWTTSDALAGGSGSPLRRELAATRPAWAIVMYGTNDIDRGSLGSFRTNLGTIVDIAEEAGTVVVLSTIPDRNDGAGPAAAALVFNTAIRELAASRSLPLLDYWAALQALPSHGLSADRIHPSVYTTGGTTEPAYFTEAALRFGYNMRNLTAIQALERLRSLP
jgi:hypothetical protein